MIDIFTAIEGFVVGTIVTAGAAYRFIAARITPEKAERIRDDIKKVIADYNAAKAKGSALTADDKLKIADDAIQTLSEIVKDLET